MKLYSEPKSHVHGHVPYGQLQSRMATIIKHRINPEIFLTARELDSMIWEEVSAQMELLHSANLSTTIHAPFIDLNPGALDPAIREVTAKRVGQVFKAAEYIKPKVIVFHPGYDDIRYGNNRLDWLKNSIDFWQKFIPVAEDLNTIIAIENIFEKEPSTLKALLESVDNPCFRHCFDVGHWNMFSSTPLEEWFYELGNFIAESHIHDNHGIDDEHLPPGEGKIDFECLFNLLKQYAPQAVWTLEAHSLDHLEKSLNNIVPYC